jgi:hypothetical protein
MSPTELWLPIGAVAFYLYDAVLMLGQNELVYTRAGRGWRVDGGTALRLGGRRLFMPLPWLPQRPQFLVRWSSGDSRGDTATQHAPLEQALRPIGVVNMLQLVLLVALPAALWIDGAGLAALLVFVLFYLLTVVALVLMFRRRETLKLTRRAAWMQALDALACAPFAINLTRKLAMQYGIAADPLVFANQHFDAATLAQTRDIVAARVNEQHADPDAEGLRIRELAAVMSRLT